ncbi:thiolase family protein [Microbispora sp. H11081]|uniref:thiolase family protein n=1 Tax=Microbispora sp. H11081 TaxID=2729107 RepID=UPI001474289C|nr:thiolase family protein [Microbispora sp. H11081]
MDERAVVVAARRTPIGTAGHAFRGLPSDRLAAPVVGAVARDVAHLGVPVDDVVLGNCTGPGGNLARVCALAAGLGHEVPGVTVDRQCGSGLAAILLAAQAVRSGDADLVVAGGVESASTAPLRIRRGEGEPGVPYERAPFAPEGHPDPDMGPAAEALAAARGVTRERQDAYARRSHARALAAREAGRFAREIVPVCGRADDQRPRVLRPESLARLPAAFVPGGTVTAGNSSPVSDGAAAVAVVPERLRAAAGLPGLRLLAGAVAGCDPALPGWGPVPAVRRVLRRTGTDLESVAAVEIVEAFAAQVLAVTDALGLDPLGADSERVCADGGALALGHPWGASGAVVVTRLFSRLAGAPRGSLGLAAVAVGGGLGIAALFEVV